MMPAVPRMSESVVPKSASRTSSSSIFTVMGGKPSLSTTITPSSVFATQAMVSRFTAAASTRPLLWSVWLPPISVRPGAEKKQSSCASPKRFSKRSTSLP